MKVPWLLMRNTGVSASRALAPWTRRRQCTEYGVRVSTYTGGAENMSGEPEQERLQGGA